MIETTLVTRVRKTGNQLYTGEFEIAEERYNLTLLFLETY